MDMIMVEIPAQTTKRFQTEWLKYKAHEHELDSAGLLVDGEEIPVKIVR